MLFAEDTSEKFEIQTEKKKKKAKLGDSVKNCPIITSFAVKIQLLGVNQPRLVSVDTTEGNENNKGTQREHPAN